MATVTLPVTLTANTNENINDLTADLNALVAGVNSIDDANISASAGIQASKLASGVTGLAQGVFRAYRSAGVNYSDNTAIVFDAEDFDVSGWHDVATGRYTPQVAGYYRLSWGSVPTVALAADVFWRVDMLKVAAVAQLGQMGFQRGATQVNSFNSGIFLANGTTDYFTAVIRHGVGAVQGLLTGSANTFMCGELIGRS